MANSLWLGLLSVSNGVHLDLEVGLATALARGLRLWLYSLRILRLSLRLGQLYGCLNIHLWWGGLLGKAEQIVWSEILI